MAIVSKTMFTIWRALEIITLIPIWAMLAYFVHQYDRVNQTPPVDILVLFIVSLVATFWVLITFFQFHHRASIPFIVFIVDLIIFGGFIAGVVLLRGIRNANCSTVQVPVSVRFGDDEASWGNEWEWEADKECMMLKASWGLGIANTIMFFFTAVLALLIYDSNVSRVRGGKVYVDRGSSEISRGHRRRYW